MTLQIFAELAVGEDSASCPHCFIQLPSRAD
jgi:hypothetical protein